jgi:hypothetical protein
MKKLLLILLTLQSAILFSQEKNDSAKIFYYFFNTDPYNAEVIYKDSTFGYTPLKFFSNDKLEGNIIFRKNDFQDKIFDLNNYDFNKGELLELEPINRKENKLVFIDKETQFKTKRNFNIIGGLGVGTLASFIATVHFKNIANNSYDNYTNTLDKSELDKSNRYDVYSAITLIAMQAALAGLVYFLFFDK